jgi:hypothetical protein
VTAANIQHTIKLLCVKISMMETEINISKSVDLEGGRQACIHVTYSSWNTKKSKRLMAAVFLKT